MAQTMHEEMRAHGVVTPSQEKVVEDAVRAGVSRGQILDWLKAHGAGILSVIQAILALTGKTAATATAGGTQTHPSPPAT